MSNETLRRAGAPLRTIFYAASVVVAGAGSVVDPVVSLSVAGAFAAAGSGRELVGRGVASLGRALRVS